MPYMTLARFFAFFTGTPAVACRDSVLSMAETLSAASESDDDSNQLVSIHEAARTLNVSQLRRALAARGPSSPLRLVPPEVLRKIAAFAFHVGYY